MTQDIQLKMLPRDVRLVGKWIKLTDQWERERKEGKNKDWVEAAYELTMLFFGLSLTQVNELTLESVVNASERAVSELARIKADAFLVGVVEIDGKRFEFNKNLNEIKYKKILDIKKHGKEIMDRPGYFLAVLYDEVGEPTLSRKDKEELFLDKFPVDEFLAVTSFFFQVLLLSKQITFLQNEEAKNQKKILQIGTSGRTQSSLWLRILGVMLTRSQKCTIAKFYSGKSILGRNTVLIKQKLTQRTREGKTND